MVFLVSVVSVFPVYANDTETSDPAVTQESSEGNEGAQAYGTVVHERSDGSFYMTDTSDPEDNASGLATIVDLIHNMDELVQILGAENVSIQSDTEIQLIQDVVFPEDIDRSIRFVEGEYTIDFNTHTIMGKFGFVLFGGDMTLMDSSASSEGGLHSDAIFVSDETCSYHIPLAVKGGNLQITSGTHIGFKNMVVAQTGSLLITGGLLRATGKNRWKPDNVVCVEPSISEARITGGFFSAYRNAVYCTKDTYDSRGSSTPNPLKISGGYFESYMDAIYYCDFLSDEDPDMTDIFVPDAVVIPAGIETGYGSAGDRYSRTENTTVQVFRSTGVEGFVYRLYDKVLARVPDYRGYYLWVAMLKNEERTGSDLAYGFFFSPELTDRNLSDEEFVTLLYQVILNREPDEGGMQTWLSALEIGASRNYVFSGFANSQEWKQLCESYEIEPGTYESEEPRDQNLKVTAFVQRLYTLCLNRRAEVEGLNHWTDVLNKKSQDGAHVAYGFFFSPEFIDRNLSNEDYVEVLYEVLLGRASDPAGKANWVGKLDDGVERMDVFRGFVHSQEFDQICASYGIVRGSI